MDRLKIEIVIIVFSILLLFGLGVRAKIETDIRIQENKILELKEQIKSKNEQIVSLQEQLVVPEYAQPIDKIIISSGTGIRKNPLGGSEEALHKGCDIPAAIGTSVYAVLPGVVAENYLAPGYYNGIRFNGHKVYGGYILIDHGNELFSLYAHLSKNLVHEDQYVEAGMKIGEVGNNGISTNPHLHFEIAVNPFKYLEERRR